MAAGRNDWILSRRKWPTARATSCRGGATLTREQRCATRVGAARVRRADPGLRARARSERVGRRRPMPFGLAAGGEPSDLRRCLERERLLRRTSLFKPSVAALLLTTSVNRRTSSGGRPWSIAGTECTPSSPAMTVVNPRRALAADPPRLDVEDSRVEHARRFHADEAGRAGRPLSGRRRSQRGDRTRSASLRCWHGLGRSGVCRSARSSSSSTCVT